MVRVSAVSYLNALPMVYGLQRGPNALLWELQLELPAQSALRLSKGEVALALMPVGALHTVSHPRVITEYCIGAECDVYSVCLCAHRPLAHLRTIYLDPHSRTSVQLAQILAKNYWNISVHWQVLDFSVLQKGTAADEGVVLIGDKVFGLRERFEVCYDLAAEWIAYTGLPFVFAAWVATQALPPAVEVALNEDLAWGIARIDEAVAYREAGIGLPCAMGEAQRYLRQNIDYRFSLGKRAGLQRYLALRNELALELPAQ